MEYRVLSGNKAARRWLCGAMDAGGIWGASAGREGLVHARVWVCGVYARKRV